MPDPSAGDYCDFAVEYSSDSDQPPATNLYVSADVNRVMLCPAIASAARITVSDKRDRDRVFTRDAASMCRSRDRDRSTEAVRMHLLEGYLRDSMSLTAIANESKSALLTPLIVNSWKDAIVSQIGNHRVGPFDAGEDNRPAGRRISSAQNGAMVSAVTSIIHVGACAASQFAHPRPRPRRRRWCASAPDSSASSRCGERFGAARSLRHARPRLRERRAAEAMPRWPAPKITTVSPSGCRARDGPD